MDWRKHPRVVEHRAALADAERAVTDLSPVVEAAERTMVVAERALADAQTNHDAGVGSKAELDAARRKHDKAERAYRETRAKLTVAERKRDAVAQETPAIEDAAIDECRGRLLDAYRATIAEFRAALLDASDASERIADLHHYIGATYGTHGGPPASAAWRDILSLSGQRQHWMGRGLSILGHWLEEYPEPDR